MMSTEEQSPLWVIKLSGSLWRSSRLPDWLSCLSDGAAAGRQLCVVPGGGLFAEAVREAQRHWSFPDETAHVMALLAMHQYGLMLESMSTALVSWMDKDPLPQQQGTVPVWLPAADTDWKGMPADWSATSDTLALRLAVHLGAERLWLIKTPAPEFQAMPADLVDAAFADQQQRFAAGLPVHWLGADDHGLFRQYMNGAAPPPLRHVSVPDAGGR